MLSKYQEGVKNFPKQTFLLWSPFSSGVPLILQVPNGLGHVSSAFVPKILNGCPLWRSWQIAKKSWWILLLTLKRNLLPRLFGIRHLGTVAKHIKIHSNTTNAGELRTKPGSRQGYGRACMSLPVQKSPYDFQSPKTMIWSLQKPTTPVSLQHSHKVTVLRRCVAIRIARQAKQPEISSAKGSCMMNTFCLASSTGVPWVCHQSGTEDWQQIRRR